jgi:UDP-glucose 4-epimerase
LKKNKLLITGGLGNLGSWITQYAIEIFDVTVLTRKNRDVYVDGSFKLILADLGNFDELVLALRGLSFDYVIHAGSINEGFGGNFDSISYAVNSFGTRNLVNALDLGVIKHFIYLSTFQVYGASTGEISEQTVANPKNDYGLSHFLAEHFLAIDMPKATFSVIRLTNSYGCPRDIDSSKWYLVLNDLSRSAVLDQEIKLAGNGFAVRDFIWMGDVAVAILNLLRLPAYNEIYNLSRGKTLSILDVAKAVQVAYERYCGVILPISTNLDDHTTGDSSLYVNSDRLLARISIDFHDYFIDEAINIFKLLQKDHINIL